MVVTIQQQNNCEHTFSIRLIGYSQTTALYQNLFELQGKKTLFGHQDDLAYGVGWQYEQGRSDVKEVTGKYPALYGWELGNLELGAVKSLDSVPFDRIQSYIKEGYDSGAVITISWHLNNPMSDKSAWDTIHGSVASIIPGGAKHELYKTYLDKLASFFSGLKRTGRSAGAYFIQTLSRTNR